MGSLFDRSDTLTPSPRRGRSRAAARSHRSLRVVALRHRASGLAQLLLAGGLAWGCLSTGTVPGKVLLLAPLLAASGLWMLVFGYPQGPDGLAPGWWRLGLVATAIAFVWVVVHFVQF